MAISVELLRGSGILGEQAKSEEQRKEQNRLAQRLNQVVDNPGFAQIALFEALGIYKICWEKAIPPIKDADGKEDPDAKVKEIERLSRVFIENNVKNYEEDPSKLIPTLKAAESLRSSIIKPCALNEGGTIKLGHKPSMVLDYIFKGIQWDSPAPGVPAVRNRTASRF
jgi:hypothetical protein